MFAPNLYEEPRPPGPIPYPFLYYFWQKRYPFRITSIDKWCTFHIHSLELNIPFNTSCICTVFEIWINHETGTFYRLFYSQKMHLLALLDLFTDRKTDFSTFHIRQLVESLSFHTDLTQEKGTPFGRCLLVQPIIRSVPLVLGQQGLSGPGCSKVRLLYATRKSLSNE